MVRCRSPKPWGPRTTRTPTASLLASPPVSELSRFYGIIEAPPRSLGLVVEWAALHQPELISGWQKASAQEPLQRIVHLD